MNRRDFIKYGAVLAGAGGACLLCRNCGFFTKGSSEINPMTDSRPCKIPFECFEFQEKGAVNSCCADYLKFNTPVGDIEKQSVDEIWNGKMLTELRQRVLKGDYSLCNRDVCCIYEPYTEGEKIFDYKKGPKEVKISYDFECNYNCIICRDVIKINTPKEMDLYEKVYLPKVIEASKNAEVVNLLGSGDPLFSRHSRHLMQELIKTYPKIKFNLFTNGLLLDEKNLTELGIQDNILGLSVSVDATNRETYKKVMRTDAFDRVMKNLELMADWKKQGKIGWITINFVVHIMNYKEMPKFLKIAQKLDVNAFFSGYRPWITAEYHKKYDEVAVFEPTHKDYKDFVKILKNPIFKDKEHCTLEPRLFDIVYS